jgi:hypothetical protein
MACAIRLGVIANGLLRIAVHADGVGDFLGPTEPVHRVQGRDACFVVVRISPAS